VLYVEGARDREILESWARRFDPELARCVERNAVILGGRQPARAAADFRKRGGVEAGLSGLIVLDRDDHAPDADPIASATPDSALPEPPSPSSDGRSPDAPVATEPGLEVFVWSLRHIESYLLVPAAIRRAARLQAEELHIERLIAAAIAAAPPTRGVGTPHAKRLLGPGGSLSEALGAELRAGDIARVMRLDELHADVGSLFDRIAALAGVARAGPEVVVRGRSGA